MTTATIERPSGAPALVLPFADRVYVGARLPLRSEADAGLRPFVFGNPAETPPTPWLYAPHYARGYVSMTIAQGGVGKSALAIIEALAVATGKPLLGVTPAERAAVWYLSLEDSGALVHARAQAAMQRFSLTDADLGGRLFIEHRAPGSFTLASAGANGPKANRLLAGELTRTVLANNIGLVLIDPFVKAHALPESDNGAMDRVMSLLTEIASRSRCAIALLHHPRKIGAAEITGDDGRGAGAVNASARNVRLLRKMTEREAEAFGVEPSQREDYVREEMSKSNLTRLGHVRWYRLASADHPNGSSYPVVEDWAPEQAPEVTATELGAVRERIAAGRGPEGLPWRANVQAGEAWAGHAVADALSLNLARPREKARVRELLAAMVKAGSLAEAMRPHGPKSKPTPFIVVADQG